MAVAMLLGIYVVVAGVLAALGLSVLAVLSTGRAGILLAQLAVFLLLVVLAVGRALWSAARVREAQIQGMRLTEEAEPEVWQEVRRLAEVAGTRAPDEVLLTLDLNAFVHERSRLLGLLPGDRTLAIGAPLLLGMTRAQLRTVVGHELGHYSRHHTRLAPTVYRGQLTLAHLAHQLGHHNILGRFFHRYGRLYARVAAGVTRRQELEADLVGARAGGRRAAIEALRDLPVLASLWGFFLENYAFAVPGSRPQALLEGFEALLGDPRRCEQRAAARTELVEPDPDPLDTHPSSRKRVEALEKLPEDSAADDARPATALLASPTAAFADLEAAVFKDSADVARSWDSLAAEAGNEDARASSALLARATAQPGRGAATLHQALRGLAAGDARRLVDPYVKRDDPDDAVAAYARSLVTGAVEAGLIEHCGAHHAVDWGRGRRLLDAQGVEVDVDELVGTSIDRSSADWLLKALADEGVPPGFTVDPASVSSLRTPQAEPVVRAVAVCSHWLRQRVVAISDTGLLVKRLGWWEGLAATVRMVSLDRHRTALLHVSSMPLPALLSDLRTRFHPWESVDSVALHGRRLEFVVAGRRTRMRRIRSATSRDLVGALAVLLGNRFTLRS